MTERTEATPTPAEEKKPSLPTHHSKPPWSLHPPGDFAERFDIAFEIRDSEGGIVAYLPYGDEISALELADAALIIASPRLLAALGKSGIVARLLWDETSEVPDNDHWKEYVGRSPILTEIIGLLLELEEAGVL